MATINFDLLVTIDDWAGALQQLVNDAKTAISANDQSQKLNAQDALRTFTKRSPVECEFLDNIALRTINDLFISVTDQALAAIAARNAELQQATKSIKDVSAQAKKDAKKIQFENVISVLDRAKAAADTLKTLEASLAQPDQNLLAKIKALTDAINDLRQLA
jgi:hypothetical protein